MRRVTSTSARLVAACLLVAAGWSWRVHGQVRTASPAAAIVYEGARLITGDVKIRVQVPPVAFVHPNTDTKPGEEKTGT